MGRVLGLLHELTQDRFALIPIKGHYSNDPLYQTSTSVSNDLYRHENKANRL